MIRRNRKQLGTRKRCGSEKGSALPIVMLLSVVLLGMAALAVDIIYAYVASTQAQTAANAAALAGASKLAVNDLDEAKAFAGEYAGKNVIIGEQVSINPDTDIKFGRYDRDTQTLFVGGNNPDTIRVVVRRTQATGNPLNMLFTRVLGFDAVDISTYCAATKPNKLVMLALDRSGSMGFDTAEHVGDDVCWRVAPSPYEVTSGQHDLAPGDYYSDYLGQFTIVPGYPEGTCTSEKQGTTQVPNVGGDKYRVVNAGEKVARPIESSPGGWTYFSGYSEWYSADLCDFFTVPEHESVWKDLPGKVYAWTPSQYYIRSLERPIQPFTNVQDAALSFVSKLELWYGKAGVCSFGSQASLDLWLSPSYGALAGTIVNLEPGGYTDTPGAIGQATQELILANSDSFTQKIILLVSDGKPKKYGVDDEIMRQATLDTAAQAAENDILIYAVTVGSTGEVDIDLMKEIANMTGGAQYHTTDSTNLVDIFNDIFERMPALLVGVAKEEQAVDSGGKVTGGGWIGNSKKEKLTFGFVAQYGADGASKGSLEFQEHQARNVHSNEITSLDIDGNKAFFAGTCTVNNEEGFTFDVLTEDNGEPGVADTFLISIYDGSGTPIICNAALKELDGGNVQVHK